MPTRLLVLALLLAGACAAGGCRDAPDAAPADAPPDALAAPQQDAAVAFRDTVNLSATPLGADTAGTDEADSGARLDSLLAAVAALSARVEVLAERSASARSAGAAADTAAAPAAERAVEAASHLGRNVFWALLVIALTFAAVRTTVWTLDALAERSAARRLLFKKLVPITRIVLWAFAFYVILRGIFALDAQGLAAAAAALGFAVGFASQDLLKNLFGGLVIIFDQPFQVGDKIAVGGTYGEVVSIGLRSTRIVTPDDNLVSVPNGQIVDGQVSNANAGALDCQVVVDLYLPGWVNVVQAKRIAYEAAAHSRYVFLDKPVVVNVKDDFRETFLTHLKVKAYVIDTRYEFAFASDVTEAAKAEFLRAGLLQPFIPYRTASEAPPLPASEEQA